MAAIGLADEEARLCCLTDFDSVIAVEAAAGTGKTSLLASRVVMLLAAGHPASEIAAITYTELAAGELARRIQHTIEALLSGNVPPELKPCFPNGVGTAARENLAKAASDFDGITVSTIHGFCKLIIGDHAVSAGMDPGFTVADEAIATNLMDGAFSGWLKATLDSDANDDDPIVGLCHRDPQNAVSVLRKIIALRVEHRTARAVPPTSGTRPDITLCDAIDDFTRWSAANPQDEWTGRLAEQCGPLRSHYMSSFDREPDFERLWDLTQPPRLSCMLKNVARFAAYDREAAWKHQLGEESGTLRAAEAKVLLAAIERSLAALLGEVGTRLVHSVSTRLDGVMTRYEEAKANAAVMDFQDLLIYARNLVTEHEDVRLAVANRFKRILVDEFQDTDPVQCEILFAIAAASGDAIGRGAKLRHGSLFLVGDPKQAIYRFRGADISTYLDARQAVTALENGRSVNITCNFRSARPIVDFVNSKFASVFVAPRQPDYVPLSATLEGQPGSLHVVGLAFGEGLERAFVNAVRDEEAATIAQVCKDLVDSFEIALTNGRRRVARPSDIALLAPGHTELWRYERALEAAGLQVASQASKALARRQETQDVLALLRALCDATDTLAFGALMRGPLVGLTDLELLDINRDLNDGSEQRRYFDIRTEARLVKDPYARSVLETLQQLRTLRHSTTPALFLAEAVEALSMRLVLASRYRNKNAQALANIDALIERARRFSVSGLDSFIDHLQGRWENLEQMVEGRIDASEDAIQIVSMHSCKGLEWPIVIPINRISGFRREDTFVHRRSDDTLHWVIAGMRPPHLDAAMAEEREGDERERERLMYVACTRARDLLVLPSPPSADSSNWTSVVDLGVGALPSFDLLALERAEPIAEPNHENGQTAKIFADEATLITKGVDRIVWKQPSAHDPAKFAANTAVPLDIDNVSLDKVPVGVGLERGSLLHKLMEEVLTGELVEREEVIAQRSVILAEQLNGETRAMATRPLPAQLARTVMETFALPDIVSLRPYLFPEVSVWGQNDMALIAGRADCLIVHDDRILGVIDWKSDVAPTPEIVDDYAEQVRKYMDVTGAPTGLICFMTHGTLVWIGDRQSLFDDIAEGERVPIPSVPH